MRHFGDFLIGGSSLHWSTNPTLVFDFFFVRSDAVCVS